MTSSVPEHDQWAYHKRQPTQDYNASLGMQWPPIGIDKLSDIALLLRNLTYGEMIGFSKALLRFGPITDLTLPDVLWNWSQTYGSAANAENDKGTANGDIPMAVRAE